MQCNCAPPPPGPLQEGRLQSYDEFRVRPFLGLTVCFSGLGLQRKSELAKLVEHNGGQHSPALDKQCTHLVTDTSAGPKYR